MNQFVNINPDAKICSNVKIDSFVTVEADVVIGDGTWIGANAVIMNGSRMGKNCRIFPAAVIGGIPQDMKFQGEITTVEIGDNTSIREFVTVNRATKSRMKTVIGSNCLLMSSVHIGHDCNLGNNVIVSSATGIAGEVNVGDWAIIGGMTAVHQFVNIGAHAFVGGASKVSKDVPPYIKAARDPLSYAGINSIGMRRRNYSIEKIEELKEIYRFIYQKGYNRSQAIAIIETEMPETPERNEIIHFVKTSKRGIIKGYFDKANDEDVD